MVHVHCWYSIAEASLLAEFNSHYNDDNYYGKSNHANYCQNNASHLPRAFLGGGEVLDIIKWILNLLTFSLSPFSSCLFPS